MCDASLVYVESSSVVRVGDLQRLPFATEGDHYHSFILFLNKFLNFLLNIFIYIYSTKYICIIYIYMHMCTHMSGCDIEIR